MNDVILKMSGKIESSYLKGRKEYKLSNLENDFMRKHGVEVINLLRDFDGISCTYDEIKSEVIFKNN